MMGAGVLLAAGASRRMGSPKALLPWGATTFAGHLARLLLQLPLSQRGVVCRFPLEVELPQWLNPEPDRGMLSSLQVALQQLQPNTPWMLVCLVDQPAIPLSVFQAMVDNASPWGWASPVCGGRRGHPVVIGQECFSALRQASPERNPREVLSQFSRRLVEVEEESIGLDFDTPQEWQNYLRGPGMGAG